MSETFEEWWGSMNSNYPCYGEENHKNIAANAWNHQQSKIDALQARVEELEAEVNRAAGILARFINLGCDTKDNFAWAEVANDAIRFIASDAEPAAQVKAAKPADSESLLAHAAETRDEFYKQHCEVLEEMTKQPSEAQEPVAWYSTLSFDGKVADMRVTLVEPRYPFGIAGRDYRAEGSRVDWYPLFFNPTTLADLRVAADKLGYVVVPKEPTEKMIDAAVSNKGTWKGAYRAMIDATAQEE